MNNKTLQEIQINNISPNPFNPRLIFNREELDELKKSIKKVGILVPVTVYRNTKSFPKTDYILLDGERRWRCSKELSLETIAANVIDEPTDDTQNILFMFNIHHYRREWELFPTALKLETLMKKMETDQESVLASFTGVSRSTIRRCKTLLWFPEKYRDLLTVKNENISTDFFIEIYPIAYRMSAEDGYHFPEGVIRLVDGLIEKFRSSQAITDVKEFREIRRSMAYHDKNQNFAEFVNLLERFIKNNDLGNEIFSSTDESADKQARNILKYISYLNQSLENIDPDLISDFIYVDQFKILDARIKRLLEDIE